MTPSALQIVTWSNGWHLSGRQQRAKALPNHYLKQPIFLSTKICFSSCVMEGTKTLYVWGSNFLLQPRLETNSKSRCLKFKLCSKKNTDGAFYEDCPQLSRLS